MTDKSTHINVEKALGNSNNGNQKGERMKIDFEVQIEKLKGENEYLKQKINIAENDLVIENRSRVINLSKPWRRSATK